MNFTLIQGPPDAIMEAVLKHAGGTVLAPDLALYPDGLHAELPVSELHLTVTHGPAVQAALRGRCQLDLVARSQVEAWPVRRDRTLTIPLGQEELHVTYL